MSPAATLPIAERAEAGQALSREYVVPVVWERAALQRTGPVAAAFWPRRRPGESFVPRRVWTPASWMVENSSHTNVRRGTTRPVGDRHAPRPSGHGPPPGARPPHFSA